MFQALPCSSSEGLRRPPEDEQGNARKKVEDFNKCIIYK